MTVLNGRLPDDMLATIPGTTRKVRKDLVAQTAAMRAAFEKRFGKPLYVTDGYRAYNSPWMYSQEQIFRDRYTTETVTGIDPKRWLGMTWWRRPGTASAAVPGTSNHGWGQALDLGSGVNSSLSSPEHLWMRANGPRFGWTHPFWAHDPARPYLREPWHFEATVVPVSNFQSFLVENDITVPGLPDLTPLAPVEDEDMKFIKGTDSGKVYATNGVVKHHIPTPYVLSELQKLFDTDEVVTLGQYAVDRIPDAVVTIPAGITAADVVKAVAEAVGQFEVTVDVDALAGDVAARLAGGLQVDVTVRPGA